MTEIEECLKKELSFLYLGYWIDQSPKMAYKTKFRPYQIINKGQWVNRK